VNQGLLAQQAKNERTNLRISVVYALVRGGWSVAVGLAVNLIKHQMA
jgi:hypothetical protein